MSSSRPFAKWIKKKIKDKYGSDDRFLALPEIDPLVAPRWIVGAVKPSIDGQIKIADALGLPLAEVRTALGLPHNAFGEYLARLIISKGSFADFCQEADLALTKVHKWIQCQSYPVRGDGSAEVAEKTARWLKSQGDPRDFEDIRSEILDTIDTHRPKRAKRRSLRTKKAKVCDLGKIA